MTNIDNLDDLIKMALREDVGDGDHSTLACIPPSALNSAKMVAKQDGLLCGIEVGQRVFQLVDNSLEVNVLVPDGTPVHRGDILMTVHGHAGSILTAERTALNFMQRLSGIATETHRTVPMPSGPTTRHTPTRKTTPTTRAHAPTTAHC